MQIHKQFIVSNSSVSLDRNVNTLITIEEGRMKNVDRILGKVFTNQNHEFYPQKKATRDILLL